MRIADADAHARQRRAERAAHVLLPDIVEERDGRRLGESVTLSQFDAGRARPSVILQLRCEQRAAAHAEPQRLAPAHCRGARAPASSAPNTAGHADERGDPLAFDEVHGAERVEARHRA